MNLQDIFYTVATVLCVLLIFREVIAAYVYFLVPDEPGERQTRVHLMDADDMPEEVKEAIREKFGK